MKYLYVATLSCSGDISTCCGDYGIAYFIMIIRRFLNVIHIAVPIILLIMVSVNLVQLMINPDDPQKRKWKSLTNKVTAAILVFLIPFIMNVLVNMTPDTFSVSGCWRAAEETSNVMNGTTSTNVETTKDAEKITVTLPAKNASDIKPKKKKSKKKSSDSKISGKASGANIVKFAKQFVGNPYVWGGTSLTNGADCSGFSMKVYEHFGISIPRTAAQQAAASNGKSISSISKAKAGDLFFYRDSSGGIGHVAIYEGNGKVVHASNARDGIKESDVSYRPVAIIKRFV